MNPNRQLVSKARIEALGSGRFRVTGALNAYTAPTVLEQSHQRFGTEPRLIVNLDGVVESDSSGLALVLEWLRAARQRGQVIELVNLPAQLMALARISEVEDLLSSEAGAVTT